ncbi:bacterioferritin-associated ferredoxin [Pelomicrobium methylotrophicum]|uniref:Bacterioferritin-associated ferredoxin n=1 Tax=Pelomicrobium methylotrophicum TaxID=2602750 RepID=A0A5C7EWK5_9PROT|nr:bacterioferritin-associated ferredoxin [Pelomicrobium methylotrophicum]TXF11400.1 regulatory or redox protein complexing with Bfr, in iron storage and mobility [Pelomicrobium methylotrophicum]
MYVCLCNAITDREIRQCAERGVSSLEELRETLGVATCCGRCAQAAQQILEECMNERPHLAPAASS